jgi:hypothetical protein
MTDFIGELRLGTLHVGMTSFFGFSTFGFSTFGLVTRFFFGAFTTITSGSSCKSTTDASSSMAAMVYPIFII